jgi:hypothetical protein
MTILISGLGRRDMEVEIDDEDYRTVYINKTDRCVYCEQQYGCPLIECLANGLVEATSGGINILDCAHYRMFDR